MWKEYSISYLKGNKNTSITIMVAAFISALFLSFITCLFYNAWVDNVNRIEKEEGDWQVKIVEELSENQIQQLQSMANVKEVRQVNKDQEREVLIYFHKKGKIYKEMPRIAQSLGMGVSAITYHEKLLEQYFIVHPQKERPPMLLGFYLVVMTITSISLILIIRNAFLISMESRLHQLGILQSIGATPRQIRVFLLQEAMALCLLPVTVGIVGGVGLCYGMMMQVNRIVRSYGIENATFYYHVGLFFVAFLVSILTVLCSAWIPARRISKMSPLQAVQGAEESGCVKKINRYLILSFLFGIEGELAGKSFYVRRKSLRTATMSLTLSILAFSMFLSFRTLSGISTKYTYFERYKDAWDIMTTIKNKNINSLENILDIDSLEEVESYCVYQKAQGHTWLTKDMISGQLNQLGEISKLKSIDAIEQDGKYQVKVAIVVMDQKSFQEYYKKIGENPEHNMEGMITVNRIWDSVHSNFRKKKYIPFLKEEESQSLLFVEGEGQEMVEMKVPILTYTNELPVLREEYGGYGLVQIMSADTWNHLWKDRNTKAEETYVKIQTVKDEDINTVEDVLKKQLEGSEYHMENRLEEMQYNKDIQKAFTIMTGGFCGLLALIGLSNVFCNTLAYINQRKREFAQYLSVGFSPKGIGKMLCIEALIIGGKPVLISLPITMAFVVFAVNASHISLIEFLKNALYIPFMAFLGMIWGSIALAYYMGGRKILNRDVMEILKNDALT